MSRGNIILITKHKMRFGWPLRVTQIEHVQWKFRFCETYVSLISAPLSLCSLHIERPEYVRRLGGKKKSGSPFSRPTPSVSPPPLLLPPGLHLIPLKNRHLVESMRLFLYGTESPFCLRKRIHKSSKMRTRDENKFFYLKQKLIKNRETQQWFLGTSKTKIVVEMKKES